MNIIFRDAGPADAQVLHSLFQSSFCETFAHLYQPDDLEAFLKSSGIEDWEAQLQNPEFACRMAELDGEPVGFLKIGPVKLSVEANGPALLLDQLYILKDYHGAGIAQELMDWAFLEAGRRGADRMFLTVYVDNHRARRFYDRYGFEAVGRYDFMVGNHADEDIIMRKML